MKKLIIINLILCLLYIILPNKPNEIHKEIVKTQENNSVEEKQISITTRGMNMQRQPKKVVDNISQAGIDMIKKYEGLFLTAYHLPGESYNTIGYGHYGSDVYWGQTITAEEAENLLRDDLQYYVNKVLSLGLELSQNELDALVSFSYNCGEGSLYKLTRNRTKQEIAECMLLYTKSGSESNRAGLLRRRTEERELFLRGE